MIATRRPAFALLCLALLFLWAAGSARAASLRSPEEFFGHPLGQDRQLLGWDDILRYLHDVADHSDRADLVELGPTTQGRPFVMMILSDESGISNQDDYRAQVRELYAVDETDEERARAIAREGKAIVAFSLGLHSTEVGASQASMEMIYRIVTDESAAGKRIRENLLILMVPCMNPDGLEIVRSWYEQTLGTESEGSRPLDLYHPYAGHDNNRDGYFNNLVETSYWSRMLYHDWLPQMIVDEHQMGGSGPRLFLPPFDDPVSPTVHPLVYSQLAAAGQQVVSDLTSEGHRGIATETIFTAEWPGSVRSTGFWHNMLGVLSEVASARLATPLYYAPGSLRSSSRGLNEYERRTNFLEPWPGGWWRLRDIVDLDLDLTAGFLRWASQHRDDLLLNFWRMNRDAVQAGRSEGTRDFVIPRLAQNDRAAPRRLVELLRKGGVEVGYAPGDLSFGDYRVDGGAWVVSTQQPFRPYVLEMLGASEYPMLRDESGELIRPYDVTAWSLPLLLGAKVLPLQRTDDPLPEGAVSRSDPETAPKLPDEGTLRLAARDLRSFADVNRCLKAGLSVRRVTDEDSPARGDFLVEAADLARHSLRLQTETWSVDSAAEGEAMKPVRVAIYAPFGGSSDEGWTRLLLARYGFDLRRIRPGQPELATPEDGRKLRRRADVLILPDIAADELRDGRQTPGQARLQDALWPEEFRRGLGGVEAGSALRRFVEEGGTLVGFNRAVNWAVENMGLPVAVGPENVERSDFYAPGTLLRAEVENRQALGWGMPAEAAVYFSSGVFLRPLAWPERTEVVVRYAAQDLRLAGFLQGPQHLAGKPAMVEMPVGQGHVVLFGFNPQRRAQTEGTFKLLFNALWLTAAD